MTRSTSPLRLLIAGHVDHGKSTLVGRLLHETGSLPEGRRAAIEKSCAARGQPFEWAFLTDALKAERDQNVTIETAHIILKGKNRDIALIDAPGHHEFLRNMITGAAQADAALIVIDAKEGVAEQSRRHGYLAQMLGIRQALVAVNKMDAVAYGEKTFRAVEKEYGEYLKKLGLVSAAFIPVSAREGDNLVSSSPRTGWYKGPALLEALADFKNTQEGAALLRFPVQDVYKSGEKRIIAGRIESGTLRVGDTLLFSPSEARARVASIESWGGTAPGEAVAGQSIGITLDEPVFVERGQVASHMENAPMLTNLFRTRIFWLGREPLVAGRHYAVRIGTQETRAELRAIEHVVASETLEPVEAAAVERGQIAEVTWRTRGVVAVDDHAAHPRTGRMVILEGDDIAGGGTIETQGFFDLRAARAQTVKSENIFDVDFGVGARERAMMNGHAGGILWLTGLSGSGKSTLAMKLQQQLFARGCQVYVLDGDNIRHGLSRDLGFSHADRTENIRRVAEVAALFAQAGMIVITAFISPYRRDRGLARAVAPDLFHEIYVEASLEACERRDAKGLYKKARAGKIAEFTGISSPYEPPENPELTIDTEHHGVEECTAQLLSYVQDHLIAPAEMPPRED